MLIPAVFTSVFTILPKKHEIVATALAGVVAMVAPTVGPYVGGWLTQTYSWHWIFLINVVPGILVCSVVGFFVPVGQPNVGYLRRIDYATVLLAALFLGTLELLLKEAPPHHWAGLYVYSLFTICAVSGAVALYLCFSRPHPFIELRRFSRLSFAVGCSLSFVAGMGLYGSTYILAIFLGGVREHTPIRSARSSWCQARCSLWRRPSPHCWKAVSMGASWSRSVTRCSASGCSSMGR
jgi:DHA2 family multidrug resistance protein